MAKVIGRVVRAIVRDEQNCSTESAPTIDTDLRKTAVFLLSVAFVGLASLSIWALTRSTWPATFSAVGLGILLAGSASLVGGILGLLFGIPKSNSEIPNNSRSSPTKPLASERASGATDRSAANASADEVSRTNYSANTNLEQVSDWLTKIIVGVSLTQVATLREQFTKIAHFFAGGFTEGKAETVGDVAAAASIMTYGLTAGFLAGYLLTRIFLPGAFNRADEVLRRRITALVTQSAEDREASEIAGRVQGEIYNDLYRYNEKGFAAAIKKLEQLLEAPINANNAALWTYLAAAHGQAYQWESAHGKNRDLLELHRSKALDAVKHALELGDAWKPILQLMWNKNHPVKRSDEWARAEDDLEAFFDDPEFKKLLGDTTP